MNFLVGDEICLYNLLSSSSMLPFAYEDVLVSRTCFFLCSVAVSEDDVWRSHWQGPEPEGRAPACSAVCLLTHCMFRDHLSSMCLGYLYIPAFLSLAPSTVFWQGKELT